MILGDLPEVNRTERRALHEAYESNKWTDSPMETFGSSGLPKNPGGAFPLLSLDSRMN